MSSILIQLILDAIEPAVGQHSTPHFKSTQIHRIENADTVRSEFSIVISGLTSLPVDDLRNPGGESPNGGRLLKRLLAFRFFRINYLMAACR
jgi:hypothetical protein